MKCFVVFVFLSFFGFIESKDIEWSVNSRMSVTVLQTLTTVGPRMCTKRCLEVGYCGGVNYERSSMTCEMLHPTVGSVLNSTGWRYVSAKDIVDNADNAQEFCSCPVERSIRLKSGGNACMPEVFNRYNDSQTYTSCRDVPNEGVFYIQPFDGIVVRAMCYANGWMVFQQNTLGTGDASAFDKSWVEYKYGFGDPTGKHWLGNQFLHMITSCYQCELQIRISIDTGVQVTTDYTSFTVSNESDAYRLHVSGYQLSSTAGDAFNSWNAGQMSNGKQFTTRDISDSPSAVSCAGNLGGGWWYDACRDSNLNGWSIAWSSQAGNVDASTMMIRINPKS